jgi:rhodanese-related sulfurtransferase
MSETLKQLTADQLKRMREEGRSFELIDVRRSNEHQQFNIGGKLIPLDEIISQASKIPRDKEVILYCKMGIRSAIAIQRLQDKFGFNNLFNLKGGIEAWKKELGNR